MQGDSVESGLLAAGLIAVALPLFAIFWVLITGVLASISGWPNLADTFPAGERPDSEALRRSVLKIGRIGENNVTTLRPTPQGLYMSANPLFRFRRPPVLVPWNRIEYVTSHRVLWQRSSTLDLGGITTIRVRNRVLPVLRAHGVRVPDDGDA